MNNNCLTRKVADWCLRLLAAAILGQTLFFKFSGAPESVYIFTKVALEPWGRYATGVGELIAAILLLTPRFAWLGALLALGIISGAIASHLTVLGIVVQDDGGLLFGLAVIVFLCSALVAFQHRSEIPVISQLLPTEPSCKSSN